VGRVLVPRAAAQPVAARVAVAATMRMVRRMAAS
jgi:hypothetical protein